MNKQHSIARFPSASFPVLAAALAGFLLLALGTPAAAQSTDIIRIDEDWELTVGEPDTAVTAPQIVNVVSPVGGLDGLYCIFNLNHATAPDAPPGGMQTQVFNGETLVSYQRGPKYEQMYIPGEVVTWTQQLRVESGSLIFEIVNGDSQTWGAFGGQGYLKEQVAFTTGNLNGYTVQDSVDYSGVAYAANRVASLKLLQVRWYDSGGLVNQTTDAVTVHSEASATSGN